MARNPRLLAVLLSFALVLLPPLQAHAAAVTWAAAGTYGVVGTCAAETMDAPTLVTQGLSLTGVTTLAVSYESTTGNLTVGARKLIAYWWNPLSARENKWDRAPSMDLDVDVATDSAHWEGLSIRSAVPGGRIAYVPSTIGQAGKVYILGTR